MRELTYEAALRRLTSLQRRDPDPGPETTAALLDALGSPHRDLACVQIAGTNGKGSTAHTLANVLDAAGYDVGLYTSPGLGGVRDRIRVRGRRVPERTVARFVEAAWPFIEQRRDDAEPTFFEATTALALWAFERAAVDVAVLEAGMGGGMDATSAVDPVASAVTSVSLEHTAVLGETRSEIARELGRVAPDAGPLVTGATGDALAVLRELADVRTVGLDSARRDSTAPDVRVRERADGDAATSTFSLVGPEWALEAESSMLGRHQAVNAGVAAALARQVGRVSTDSIRTGVERTAVPGRFELREAAPTVVLDGAHNPAACRALAALLERFDYEDCYLVFGAMTDKDHAGMWAELPTPARVSLVRADAPRAAAPARLADVLGAERTAVRIGVSIGDALDAATQRASADDLVLVTGSLALVAQARDHVSENDGTRTTPTN